MPQRAKTFCCPKRGDRGIHRNKTWMPGQYLWLDQIPLHAVGELHVAGHLRADDIVIDDHGSRVFDAVWKVFCHAQRRFGCLPTLVEWDTDIAPLPVLLQQAARPRSAASGLGGERMSLATSVAIEQALLLRANWCCRCFWCWVRAGAFLRWTTRWRGVCRPQNIDKK